MHPKKLENLADMPPRERAGYFIRRAADFEEFWGVSTAAMFYVWPELEFAEKFIPKVLMQTPLKLHRIDLHKFMNEDISKMVEDNVNISVFYGADEKSWIYSPKEMKEALEEELKQYM